MNPDDLILISVDDHIAEPATMFEAHVPQKYRDRMPRVVTDERGRQKWWYGDLPGRMLGLNSYENRVYQIWLEDNSAVVLKFYRPGRWTKGQIDEEHAFAHELDEREVPVVAVDVPDGYKLPAQEPAETATR